MTFLDRFIRKLGLIFNLSWVARYQKEYHSGGGDLALRYKVTLSPGDVVFDLGAFEGEFCHRYMSRGVKFHLFEINPSMVSELRERFSEFREQVIVNPYGLGPGLVRGKSVGKGAGASLQEDENQPVIIKPFEGYLKENDIEEINLLKINIEGPEYDLIEHLVAAELIGKIDHIQIQAHDFVEDAFRRLLKMHRLLSRTHQLEENYPFVWDFWVRK